MTGIPELTEEQLARAIPASVRKRLVLGQIESGEDIATLRRFVGLTQTQFAFAMGIGRESHASPRMGNRAQAVINDQVLKTCDLLVAVFWTRLGSPTGESLNSSSGMLGTTDDESMP